MHWYRLDRSSSDVRLAAYHVTCSHGNDDVKREQLLLPFVGEAIFADERSARARNDIVKEKHTKEGLFGRVEEMSEPVTITAWGPLRSDGDTFDSILTRTRASFRDP
jgi:hypothetical protein